jgi:hypothetical protein
MSSRKTSGAEAVKTEIAIDVDRGYLTEALLTDVPDLMKAGQADLARQKNAAADPAEPQASFRLQRSTSQEGLSGRLATDV